MYIFSSSNSISKQLNLARIYSHKMRADDINIKSHEIAKKRGKANEKLY